MPQSYPGKLADPEFRRARARKASAAAHSVDAHVARVVADAPKLSPEHIERLRALLPPVDHDAEASE